MDRDIAWTLSIQGFIDTAYARRVATRLAAGPLLAVRFTDPARPRGPFDEFFVRDCAPAEALAALAAARPLPEHYVTVLEDRPDLVPAYARGGYQLSHREQLMACDLDRARLPPPDVEAMVAATAADADWLNAHDPQRLRWINDDHLADPQISHYALIVDGLPAARGRNVRLDQTYSFVSRIYTAEPYRRRGLARALMLRVLADDRARGARWSVLTASVMGESLYAALGYRALGTIAIFEPA